jgi:hypothetical protein
MTTLRGHVSSGTNRGVFALSERETDTNQPVEQKLD